MPTLGLSQIVKNESHVIERMLSSIESIVDYITIVDTGSTDDTIKKIEDFCNRKKIPFTIEKREFDNFSNCRNYAMELAKDKTDYSFFLDADEVLNIDNKFNKNNLTKDIYGITTQLKNNRYVRLQMWSNKIDIKWVGPIHEVLDIDKEKHTIGVINEVWTLVRSDGASWMGGIAEKYRNHAQIFEKYINEEDRSSRWVFYCAQSYSDSARVKNNYEENEERLRRAMYYYNERLTLTDGNPEERYISQLKIADIKKRLGYRWIEIKQELLKAHSIDPLRGESLAYLIEYYQSIKEFETSHIYSMYAYNTYHEKSPYPKRNLFIDVLLYEWKFLKMYMNSCYYTGDIETAKKLLQKLLDKIKMHPNLFNKKDIEKIEQNKKIIFNTR